MRNGLLMVGDKGFNGRILKKLIADDYASVRTFSYLFTIEIKCTILAISFSRREPPALYSGL